MTTVHYMTSSHGISKRSRLSKELSGTRFQQIDETSLPVVERGLQESVSVAEYKKISFAFLKRNELKDLQNDSVHVTVTDSCIGSSKEYLRGKYNVKVCKEVQERVMDSKMTDKIEVKDTYSLEKDQFKDVKKAKTIGCNTIDHEKEQEPSTTLSHRISKENEAEFSIDSVKSELYNVLNETCNNSKDSIKNKQNSVENSNLVSFKNNCANELPKIDKLESTQQEEYNNSLITSDGAFCIQTEFYNDGEKSIEESSNSLNLKDIGGFVNTLKTNQLHEVDTLENNKIELELNNNSFNEPKQYAQDYKMFSDVIQKARNKVKPRTKGSQPNINVTEQNAVLLNNLYALELNKSSKALKDNDNTSKLSTYLLDMEEMEDFLDFCNDELAQMMSHFLDVRKILHFLSVQAEYIEIIMDTIESIEGQNIDTDFKLTNDTILNLGNPLINDVIQNGRTWRYAFGVYKMNLDIVADTMFNFCSVSIESTLLVDPDHVYGVFEEVKSQLDRVQIIRNQVINLFATESANLQDIRERIARFREMSDKIPLTY